MASAEHDNALHERSPAFRSDGLIPEHGEAYLIAGTQGIDFVPYLCAVEINPLRLVIINIVDGYGIRVAVIAVHGKHAPPTGL